MHKLTVALLAVAISALPLRAQQFFNNRFSFEQTLLTRAVPTTTIDFEGIVGPDAAYTILEPTFTLGPVTFEMGSVSDASAGINPYVVNPVFPFNWNSGAVFSPIGDRTDVFSRRSSVILNMAPTYAFGINYAAFALFGGFQPANFAFSFAGAGDLSFEQERTFSSTRLTSQFFGVLTDKPFTTVSLTFDDVGAEWLGIFDDITVATLPAEVTVPEPTVLPLLAVGLMGLAFVARRRSSVSS